MNKPMNKIEQLIEELCPQGVEFLALGEVATLQRGTSITKKKINKGIVPVIAGGQKPAYYHNESNREGETIVVAGSGAYAGFVTYWTYPVFVSDAFSIIPDNDVLNTKYTYYFLKNLQQYLHELKSGGGVPHVYVKNVSPIQIPIPPLTIQKEIVKILDNFTRLEAELEAELEARKKQYEYYRDELLTFGDDVEWKALGEEFPFIRNGFVGTVTPFFTDAEKGVRYLQGTNIHNGVISDNAIYHITKEFHKKCSRTELKADDILMVQSGHVGESAVVGEKYKGSNCHALIVMSNGGKCNSIFMNYFFQSTEGKKRLKKITTGGTIKHILASKMKKFLIPIPHIEEQNRIVAILDKFDALVNDISIGLPAEISARKKQYEYYRNQLLTFTPLDSCASNGVNPLELQDAN